MKELNFFYNRKGLRQIAFLKGVCEVFKYRRLSDVVEVCLKRLAYTPMRYKEA